MTTLLKIHRFVYYMAMAFALLMLLLAGTVAIDPQAPQQIQQQVWQWQHHCQAAQPDEASEGIAGPNSSDGVLLKADTAVAACDDGWFVQIGQPAARYDVFVVIAMPKADNNASTGDYYRMEKRFVAATRYVGAAGWSGFVQRPRQCKTVNDCDIMIMSQSILQSN